MSIGALSVAESMTPSSADRAGSRLLLVNGALLGIVALAAGVSDLAGYFLNAGPMAKALHGNLDTIGVLEAHGLALILAAVLLVNRKHQGPTYHWVAASTHLLLGACNLIFWPIYGAYDLLSVGIGSTALHVTFAVAQVTVAVLRSTHQSASQSA